MQALRSVGDEDAPDRWPSNPASSQTWHYGQDLENDAHMGASQSTGGLMTQADKILMHLQAGKHLTAIEALNRFGCFRLAARIKDLKDDGHAIDSQMVELPNGKKVASYRMS